MVGKRPLEDSRDSDGGENGGEDGGLEERRGRIIRTLGMSEAEWIERERRRTRFLAHRQQWDKEQGGDNGPSEDPQKIIGRQTEPTAGGASISRPSQPPIVDADNQEQKPWESLVIGDLGSNLSRVERKNREIEQQRFIVRYHEEHSPHQVEHNRRILDQLIEDRNKMENREENNIPQDRLEKEERIADRLKLLQWALDSSQCDDEKINIRAAIRGYEAEEIPYSYDFTLIYAGHVVDRCPSYNSFCVNRSERLDRYFENYGPGWLWQEPPLADSGTDVLGMKGLCLERNSGAFGVGAYHINLEFAVQRNKVSKGISEAYPLTTLTAGSQAIEKSQKPDASCQLRTLLDSGATFPIIHKSDLARLNISKKTYPAQGALEVGTVGKKRKLKYYEMRVTVCSDEGKSLVGQGKEVVWPKEPRTLGGFCPVFTIRDPKGNGHENNRLSGMIPFDACYISSAPGLRRLWLGEDRRDVLGTSRLPAHLRFDTDKKFIFEYPEEIEDLRRAARTPDRVLFLHEFPEKPNILLTDSDVPGVRGKSELAIGHYQKVYGNSGQKLPQKVLPKRVIQVEPRKGGVKVVPNDRGRRWKRA